MTDIGRVFSMGLAACVLAGAASADPKDPGGAEHRVVLGADEYLSAGAEAIRAGRYDDGIRLTSIALERPLRPRERAAGLANLCAAHAAKEEPDLAIGYCTESIALDDGNWRPYTIRARAYLLKGMYDQAAADNELAAALNPGAAHVRMIDEMLNEVRLRPRVITQDHQ